MSQNSIAIGSSNRLTPITVPFQGSSLKRKIVAIFSGLVLVLGILVIGIVYYLTANALEKQVYLRAAALATNLSDAAAGYVSRKGLLELDALTAKYGRLDGVAYAYIQDPKGDILASSVQPFPADLKKSIGIENRGVPGSRIRKLSGKPVNETHVPLLDGQLGTAHVGLWAEVVQQDVNTTVLPIVGLIVICLTASVAAAALLAGNTIRPILELKTIADDISRGHLDTAITFQSNDEVGELARSLERMRASLRAAMARLSKV